MNKCAKFDVCFWSGIADVIPRYADSTVETVCTVLISWYLTLRCALNS